LDEIGAATLPRRKMHIFWVKSARRGRRALHFLKYYQKIVAIGGNIENKKLSENLDFFGQFFIYCILPHCH